MIEKDTIRLLRECDAGTEMGISGIEDVIGYVKSSALQSILERSKKEHSEIENEIRMLLRVYKDEGKDPPPMLKGMSWIKTNMKLMVEPSDSTVAELMTDGCNMGVKSLSKYLNQYKAADEKAKDIAKRLIHIEECLGKDVRGYL